MAWLSVSVFTMMYEFWESLNGMIFSSSFSHSSQIALKMVSYLASVLACSMMWKMSSSYYWMLWVLRSTIVNFWFALR
jgi:hypothetical protein